MLCYSILGVFEKTGFFAPTILKKEAGIPMLKALIVVLMLAVMASLFSGLFFLIKDGGKSNRVVNSLAVRVALSIILLVVILIALWQGSLTLNPTP
jgi:branched-subunit amino acid transport protein AzlD